VGRSTTIAQDLNQRANREGKFASLPRRPTRTGTRAMFDFGCSCYLRSGSRAFLSNAMPRACSSPMNRHSKALMCSSESGRYCCKSLKLFGTNLFVRKQKLLRSPINMAPNSFLKSPVSLSPGNEVPHIFTQKSRQQPRKISVSSGKGLLQQNRPLPDSCSATFEGSEWALIQL
jgi:hypothetical protein